MTAHLKQRLQERYRIELTEEVYLGWRSQIKGNSPAIVNLGEGQYQVWYGLRRVFLGYRDGEITTALPANNIMNDKLKMKLKERELATKKSDMIVRPKLPIRKPKRNEALLAAMRAEMSGRR